MADVTTTKSLEGKDLDPEDKFDSPADAPQPPTPKGRAVAQGARSVEGDVTPSIAWLVVEPRHYQEAQRIRKDNGIEAYREYIVSLVFSLDRQSVRQPHTLSKKTVGQIVAAFEARFAEKGEGQK